MFQIVYASRATGDRTGRDLAAILDVSRRRNTASGITGALLHADGVFVQVLEGREAVVRDLFDTIARDPRHDEVRKLLAQPVTEPAFRDWAMGFAEIPAAVAGEAGYFELTGEALADKTDEERAAILMELVGRLSEKYGDGDQAPA